MPNYAFPMDEIARWQSRDVNGARVTAVPVRHPGFRYGADSAWRPRSATGWVFEYHGISVYFGGDTAYDEAAFKATAARFPALDLAILPIGPVEPDSFARANHMDGRQALRAFADLQAKRMLPIHFDTFAHGIDPEGYAVEVLRRAIREQNVNANRVTVLGIGEQLTMYDHQNTPLPNADHRRTH